MNELFKVEEIANNIHKINLGGDGKLAVLSDIHWDNPKCDREKLKKHLKYCQKNNIPVFVNGDFFCLMQGKGDKRGNKSDIRPEHNNAKYLDSIVETAVEWWKPYADVLTVIGYGNHETAIIKYQETDLLRRFVNLLNLKTGAKIYVGGYSGFLVLRVPFGTPAKNTNLVKILKYFHGSGGGGVVTRGEINLTRALAKHEGFDIYCIGHIHENKATNIVRERLYFNKGKRIYLQEQVPIHLMVTGTYKEEYGDGSKGWHVERGAPIKPIGGRILTININRTQETEDGKRKNRYDTVLTSNQFPI